MMMMIWSFLLRLFFQAVGSWRVAAAHSVPYPSNFSAASSTSLASATVTRAPTTLSALVTTNASCPTCVIAADFQGLEQMFWLTSTWSVTLDTKYITVTSFNGSNATAVTNTRTVFGNLSTVNTANAPVVSILSTMAAGAQSYINPNAILVRGTDGSVGTTSFPYGQPFARVTAVDYRYVVPVDGCPSNMGIPYISFGSRDQCRCMMNSWFPPFPTASGADSTTYALDQTYYQALPSSVINEGNAGSGDIVFPLKPWNGKAFSAWLAGNEAFNSQVPNWRDCTYWDTANGPPGMKVPVAAMTATMTTTVRMDLPNPSPKPKPADHPPPPIPKSTAGSDPAEGGSGLGGDSSGSESGGDESSGPDKGGKSGSPGPQTGNGAGNTGAEGSNDSGSTTDSKGPSSGSEGADVSPNNPGSTGNTGDGGNTNSKGPSSGAEGTDGSPNNPGNTGSTGDAGSQSGVNTDQGSGSCDNTESSGGTGSQTGDTKSSGGSQSGVDTDKAASFPDNSELVGGTGSQSGNTDSSGGTGSQVNSGPSTKPGNTGTGGSDGGTDSQSSSGSSGGPSSSGSTHSDADPNGTGSENTSSGRTSQGASNSGNYNGGNSESANPPGSNANPNSEGGSLDSSGPNNASPAGPFTITSGGHTISGTVQGSKAVAINGITITAGSPPSSASGILISVESGASRIAVNNGNLLPLEVARPAPNAAASPTAIATVGGQTITASPGASEVYYDGTTLTPGGPHATIDNTDIYMGDSGFVIGGTSTIPLPTLPPTPNSGPSSDLTHVFTLGGTTFTANPTAIDIDGTTLTLGSPAITISGTPISLGLSGLVIASSTYNFPSGALPSSTTVIDGQTFTVNPTAIAVDGTSLIEGSSAITIHGTPISLGPSGLVFGHTTVSHWKGALSPTSQTSEGLGALILAGFRPGTTTPSATGTVIPSGSRYGGNETSSLVAFRGTAARSAIQEALWKMWLMLGSTLLVSLYGVVV